MEKYLILMIAGCMLALSGCGSSAPKGDTGTDSPAAVTARPTPTLEENEIAIPIDELMKPATPMPETTPKTAGTTQPVQTETRPEETQPSSAAPAKQNTGNTSTSALPGGQTTDAVTTHTDPPSVPAVDHSGEDTPSSGSEIQLDPLEGVPFKIF